MSSIIDVNSQIRDIRNSTEMAKAQAAANRPDNSEMGQDAFLMLLMTQLQNQDPLEPMGNEEFISQQAQFTQVSELQKLNTNLVSMNTMMQASSLIGKEVELQDPDDTEKTITGKVIEAKSDGKESYITLEGREDYSYPLDLIKTIREAAGA